MTDTKTFLQPILITAGAGFLGSHITPSLYSFFDSKKLSTDYYIAQYLNQNIQNQSVRFIYSDLVAYYAGYKIDDIVF